MSEYRHDRKRKPILDAKMVYTNLPLADRIQLKRYTPEITQGNLDFSDYDFPFLECCSKNKDKEKYLGSHLARDIGHFFDYMPLSEVSRMVNVVFWCLSEAMKRYGFVEIHNFGKWMLTNTTSLINQDPSTGKMYKKPRRRVVRSIFFVPSMMLKSIFTPQTLLFMDVDTCTPTNELTPRLFDSFVHTKKHLKRGKVLFQKAFRRNFSWKGYSDEYINSLVDNEVVDYSKD